MFFDLMPEEAILADSNSETHLDGESTSVRAARTSRRFKRERSKLRCDIAICERFATMVISFK